MKPAYWFACLGISFAALFGLLYGGDASHEARPDAGVRIESRTLIGPDQHPLEGLDTPTTTTEPYVSPPPTPERLPAVARRVDSHSDEWWYALARCETGLRWDWHGPIYSSAFGVLNQAVRESTDPGSAERILAGVASPQEQLVMVRNLWARAGDRAWSCAPNAWAAVPGG